MRKPIIHTEILIEENNIYVIVTAFNGTKFKDIEAYATRTLMKSKKVSTFLLERGRPMITKYGIRHSRTEQLTIPFYSRYFVLYEVSGNR